MIRLNSDNLPTLSHGDVELLKALLKDLDEMNAKAPEYGFYIAYIDDEFDDYYGCYRLKCDKLGESESFGVEMTIHELDNAMCVVSEMIDMIFGGE